MGGHHGRGADQSKRCAGFSVSGRMTCDLIVVTYRSGSLVVPCIDAARAFAPVERVIVVNNSADDELASDAARRRGALVIDNDQNRGFAAAVNQAVAQSSAPYVLLINPDIESIEGRFEAVEQVFERDARAAAVGVRLENEDGSLQDSCRREPTMFDFVGESVALSRRFPRWGRARRFRMLDWDYGSEQIVDAVSGALVVIRRDALEAVGAFDERFFVYGEELDWFVRAKRLGWHAYFTPAVRAVHRGGRSTDAPSSAMALLLQASWHTYVRKHRGRFQAVCLQATLGALELVRLIAGLVRPGHSRRAAEALSRLRIHAAGGFDSQILERFESS
jgi:N-acetylglucosaminyl-diphospho-decaprenol L-rhamnosyltransferase